MNSGLVIAGRADEGWMVRVPLPVMLKLITPPFPELASWMAARRVQLPLPSSQVPSEVSSSTPSPVESTVYSPGNGARGSSVKVVDDSAMDSKAARASARP